MLTLIPIPDNYAEGEKIFSFERNNLTVKVHPLFADIPDILQETLKVTAVPGEENAVLRFELCEDEDREGYSLKIGDDGITVFASCSAGAFYAVQTIRQLFKADLSSDVLSAKHIIIKNDKPQYRWRGLQLDESRHFFGKETVKRLLDLMAMYKLNVFHWHLTDDQGWRIEIKKYPRLTEIGAYRKGTQLGNWESMRMDETPYGGYYTREDIVEIIEYARRRCISIVPEIDFPAHCASAIAAYNELACRDIPCEVFDFFGACIPKSRGIKDWNRTLCLGKESVFTFVTDVLGEVCELFPFEYVHVGGDEAPTDEWKKCPSCQRVMKENGLKNEAQLQGWFTNRVNEFLKSRGKTMLGWNEILRSDFLDREIVVQYWTLQKDKRVTEHVRHGGKIVMSCHRAFYFDMRHSYATVKNTYCFEPKKNNVPKKLYSSVLGFEGENWSEWIEDSDQLFFRLFRRTLALSENAWLTDAAKSYDSFVKRLEHHKPLAEALGINCGLDLVTMKAPSAALRRLAKKNKIDLKDYNGEYLLDKLIKN